MALPVAATADFDLVAAWLRRAQGDLPAFMAALATRLEQALPGRVAVERRRDGLLSSHRHVARITVTLDAAQYSLALDHGALEGRRAKTVRGVTLSSERLDGPAWLAALIEDVGAMGAQAGAAHAALDGFLLS
jgi:hypothetical protein